MINKETIKQRKRVYGNNFGDIQVLWNEYFKKCGILNKEITEKDVAMSMALMKETRLNNIKNRLNQLKDNIHDVSVAYQVKELNIALEDTKTDYENYKWIANNYEEYEAL